MERIKYPRTYHLPYSQSKTDDDKTYKIIFYERLGNLIH